MSGRRCCLSSSGKPPDRLGHYEGQRIHVETTTYTAAPHPERTPLDMSAVKSIKATAEALEGASNFLHMYVTVPPNNVTVEGEKITVAYHRDSPEEVKAVIESFGTTLDWRWEISQHGATGRIGTSDLITIQIYADYLSVTLDTPTALEALS